MVSSSGAPGSPLLPAPSGLLLVLAPLEALAAVPRTSGGHGEADAGDVELDTDGIIRCMQGRRMDKGDRHSPIRARSRRHRILSSPRSSHHRRSSTSGCPPHLRRARLPRLRHRRSPPAKSVGSSARQAFLGLRAVRAATPTRCRCSWREQYVARGGRLSGSP